MQLKGNTRLLGESASIRAVRSQIMALRDMDVTVLITGETGTGKNLVAEEIHAHSSMTGAFIEVNCSALPKDLVESELFGYEVGAFTGAVKAKMGLIEAASGGTLFLDELGSLPLHVQVKLLTFLESQKIRRVGSTKETKVNTRIICATNDDLLAMISEGKFREDLFYRINVVNIHTPSLRTLGLDIRIIADAFVISYGSKYKKRVRSLSDKAFSMLVDQQWRGNVRELRNVIERSVVFIGNESTELTSKNVRFDSHVPVDEPCAHLPVATLVGAPTMVTPDGGTIPPPVSVSTQETVSDDAPIYIQATEEGARILEPEANSNFISKYVPDIANPPTFSYVEEQYLLDVARSSRLSTGRVNWKEVERKSGMSAAILGTRRDRYKLDHKLRNE